MMENFYVYIHTKTTDGSVFYVGRGKDRRFSSKRNRNNHWKNIVAKHGFFSEIIESNLTFEESNKREIFWIKSLREDGFILANITDGGGGVTGRKRTDEEKESIRIKNTGFRWSDERKKSWHGNKNAMGPKSEATKTKLSLVLTGLNKSEEHKKKISETLKGRLWTEERKAKVVGRKFSEETKAKMRESHLKRNFLLKQQKDSHAG